MHDSLTALNSRRVRSQAIAVPAYLPTSVGSRGMGVLMSLPVLLLVQLPLCEPPSRERVSVGIECHTHIADCYCKLALLGTVWLVMIGNVRCGQCKHRV